MLAAAFLFSAFTARLDEAPSIKELDGLAQKRDVDSLSKYLVGSPSGAHNPFKILKTNGAYEVGRFGWHAHELVSPSGKSYVVVSTPLTSEDSGELLFLRSGTGLQFVPESESYGIKLIRHDFDLKFDIPEKKAYLKDTLKLKPLAPTGEFVFRMSPQYLVGSISNAKGQGVPFKETDGVVAVAAPQKEDTYTIEYSGKVDLPNYAGSISTKEASLVNDYWYPMVARQPVPYDITIHAPGGWTPVGQGELVEDKSTTAEHMSRYRMDLPCVYYSVMAGPFKKLSKEVNGKWYSCWSSQMTESQMAAQAELYAPIIEFYHRFAPFPFTGYGAVDSLVYGGGALEAYSFTTWGHGSLPIEDAHEPSHTWWGGIINNTYLGSFWNESFAVFSEGLYRRNVAIGNSDERKLAFIRDGAGSEAYNVVPISESGVEVGGVGSSLGYGKGGQVLQMLEQLVGTDKMVEAMKEWIKKSKGTASDWGDFEATITQLNPKLGLKTFFDDWTRKPGYADLTVSDVRHEGGSVQMNLAFNGASYRIPLDVMVQYADGTRSFSTQDIASSGAITVASDKKPVLVSVDPWCRVLRKIEANENPDTIQTLIHSLPRYTDPAHSDYLSDGAGGNGTLSAPSDPNGKFIVGNPKTMPMMLDLCHRAGFDVMGDKLTYGSTTIDLHHGCALAIVDLGGGKRCLIGLGKTRVAADTGRAQVAITDDLGRFLRGKTEPKTSGNLTFKL